MAIRLTSIEQLLPFPTAEELLAKKNEPVLALPPGSTVLAALQRMAEKHVGLLLVIENGALLGVLSERDCARKVILQQLDPVRTPVREIMTTQVHTVPSDCKIPECIMLMHQKDIRHVPVMRGREIIGVLSVRDFMGALLNRHERLLRRLNEERLTLLYPDPSSY